MESEIERTGFQKLLFWILVLHGLACLMIAIPFRFIPEFVTAVEGMYLFPNENAMVSIVSAIYLRNRPKEDMTRYWLIFILILDLLRTIFAFNYDFFFWVISDVRIVFSLFFFFPITPLIFFVATTEFEKPDITKVQYDVFIHEEIMKHPTLEEGLNYVLSYIDDPQWEFEDGYKEAFLEYLAERDDELGQLARDRLRPDF